LLAQDREPLKKKNHILHGMILCHSRLVKTKLSNVYFIINKGDPHLVLMGLMSFLLSGLREYLLLGIER
jgi:hypothetical protein